MKMHLLVKVLALFAWSIVSVANASDIDGDGIDNAVDNCLEAPNPDQIDTDGDLFGNRCDPDFDNNLRVDFADLAFLKSKFFTPDPDADLDGNGRVDFADLAILKSMFFSPPGPGASADALKYNAGHYTKLLAINDGHDVMLESIKPGTKGFVKTYLWRELETAQGVYDFSEIESDLQLLATQGMQLIVQIMDKTFEDGGIPNPDYLSSDQYVRMNRKGGYTAIRWEPAVKAAFTAVVQALGTNFDSHPNFEGIATQETAPGLEDADLTETGYTPEKYRDALIDLLTAAAQSVPCSRIFWYQNFLPQNNAYLDDIAAAVESLPAVLMGGPDVLPDNESLQNLVYPRYDMFNGRLPLFAQIEASSYRHLHKDTSFPTKYWTTQEIFEFARDDLHANYIFWTRVLEPIPADSYAWDDDALPVIEANPVFNP